MSETVTAMDIESQQFERRLRGYDVATVRLYLRSVAEQVEQLNLRNAELCEENGRLRRELDDHRARELALQETLVSAQRMASELKEKSRAEGELLVKQARMQAEHLLLQSQDQLARIEDEIGRCKLERDTFERRLRSLIAQHVNLLDLRQKDREGNGQTGNLRLLRPMSGSEVG
jgi:cell division initiation protein